MKRPDFAIEDTLNAPVCGIDEVGRGPLAGPVVAAAVVLDRARLPADIAAQINDSKKLSEKKRAFLFDSIHACADVSIAVCDAGEIDRINILQATLLAMRRAYAGLASPPPAALVDGNKAPDLGACRVQTVVGGDAKSLSIAAASIVAKHHRDSLMKAYAIEFPHYGWEQNAGYGTAQHLKAIEIHGITPLHRVSFAPVKKYAENT